MGCSQLVYKQKVANTHELIDDGPTFIDRLSANIGAIKIMTRSRSSREVFRAFLQANTSMGDLDKLLDVYLEFAEIQDLEAEQMGSRTAAIVWRYKIICDEIKKESLHKEFTDRPKGMRAEALIWQCLGRLRSLNVVRLRRDAIVNLIHIVQHDVLCQLVGPFEQFLDSDEYTTWLKQVARDEKFSRTHLQEAAPPPMKSSLGIFPKYALESNNILLVDDSVVALKIAGRSLESGGLHVDKATNGQIALKLMLSKRYDVVLIDINMPVLDGFETVRLFRKHERMQQEQYTDEASSTSSISDNDDFVDDEEGGENSSSIRRRPSLDLGTATSTKTKSSKLSLDYRKKKRRKSFDAYARGDNENFKSLDDIKSDLALRSGGKHHRLINRAFIIGMSNDDSLRKAVNDSEMNYFLSKPFTLDKFMEAVRIGNATNGGRINYETDYEKKEGRERDGDGDGDYDNDDMTDEETPPAEEDILTLQQ